MKEKYILGLDIGNTSVGWAIVGTQTQEIIDAGVRIFPSADASQNQIRKNFRGVRRNNRRQQNRLIRLTQYLDTYGIHKPEEMLDSPLDLRIKGLEEQLTKNEIFVILYHLAKHRGVSYIEDIKDLKQGDRVMKNMRKYRNTYPCLVQKERLDKYGVFRGTNMINGEAFINTFTTAMYEKEAKGILRQQQKFYPELDLKFRKGFINIFRSKRDYYVGPGNELSRTNYGVYKTNGTTLNYLYDEFRGSCSIYHGKNGMDREVRASASSYKAQYYNILNDLCNIKVDGRKLNSKEKAETIELLKEYKLASTITKALKKLYGIDPERVTGYSVDRNGKESNHCFNSYRCMRKDLEVEGIKIDKFSNDTLDVIADILTLNGTTDGIISHFNNKERPEYELVKNLTDKEIQIFIEIKRNRKELFSKWSAFSYRLLDLITPEMLRSGDEQYTCIKRLGIQKQVFSPGKHIDYRSIVDEIYNPSVSRSVTQSIKIVNKLIKEYEFSEIILEMPKDNSLEEEKNNILKLQKKNENQRMMAFAFAGVKESQIDTKKDRRIIQKLKLYYQQRGRCLYSGKKINLKKLLEGSMDYEVDHIIPMSVSFDDSMANKVLVEAKQNQKKSNMTPYQYLSGSNDTWAYKDYKSYVLGMRRDRLINDNKKENLLMEQDIKQREIIKGYISRNTNDTRYASKVICNELQRFFIGNNIDTSIKVINGAITNQLRKATFHYQKNLKNDFKNYAQNAMICCYAGLSLNHYNSEFINIETGKILDKDALEKLDKEERAGYLFLSGWDIKTKILKFNHKIKISHKIDTKVNRLISDQTIYGTRMVNGEYYTVHKIKNIYDNKEYERLKKKLVNDKEKFLMYRNDNKTWEKLEEIIALYPKVKGSPFKEHLDKVGPLRKYAKKDNGPIITELKYLGHKIGKGIDITHKYEGAKNRVVMESLKQFRGDVYYDHNEKCYNIVPIRYADFTIQRNQYVMTNETYQKLLQGEGLIEAGETIENLNANGHEFCYSLYRNNIIGIIEEDDTDKEVKFFRYHGKNHSMKNRFEYKRIDGIDVSRKYLTFNRRIQECYKYNVDILGNYYKIDKEPLRMAFPLDNEMIG